MKPDVPVLRAKDYEVRVAPLWVAQDLVERYHYSQGGSRTGCYVHGLYERNAADCKGVAWWLPPTKTVAVSVYPEGDFRRVVSLSRLVVVPDMPQNPASYLIGRSIRLIQRDQRFECLVTYADTWRGHNGAIYKATNWEDLGLTEPQEVWTDANGRMVSKKSGPKTRTKEQMQNLGYTLLGKFPKHKYRIVLPKIKEKYDLLG